MQVPRDQEFAELRARASEGEAQAREIALDFLRAELERADSLVTLAETSANGETVIRNLSNAWRALRVAQESAEHLQMDSLERQAFRDTHGALCLRLANLHLRLPD
jgi:ubiquinone biosynthesis protein Coq4